MWGKEQEMMDNCRLAFGKDTLWWFIPTHPCLNMNYLEKSYTKAQLKQLKRTTDGFVEEEYDLNKKKYLGELRRSNFEKRIFLGTIFLFLFWFYMYG
jgi:hypothetical protein